jgi:hypothetical protein
MGHIPRYLHTLAQCVLWLAFAAQANVLVSNGDEIDGSTIVKITGEITKDDAAKISDLVRRGTQADKTPVQYRIFLNSGGGDPDAAMVIGRTLRTTTTRITVATHELEEVAPSSMPGSPYDGWRTFSPKPAICASACVLILAAGSERIAYVGSYKGRSNRVGIHRPYSTGTGGGTTAQGAARYTAIAAKVRAYLEEVGMPGRLYEEMMLVPPEKVRWLTMAELDSLGLIGKDPAYEDAMDSRAAASRGISKEEWFRRKSLADEACHAPKSGNQDPDNPELKTWTDCVAQVYKHGSVPR